MLSHKYVLRVSVKEIWLKAKLQLYLAEDLANRCSQVMGHVCTSPHLNLMTAAVGTVITVVQNKSKKNRWGGRESREREASSLRASGGPETYCSLLDTVKYKHTLGFCLARFTSSLRLWQLDYSGCFTGPVGTL